jgi:hypothetical protein
MVDMSGYAQWNPATVYILNDIVDYDGVLYISTQAGNVNRQPNTNPTFWAIIGGGGTGGITAIIAGAGITTSGSTAITITNNGVRTLTAGTNITIGGTANAPVINSAVDGVQTLTAGANVVISGTTANPIISATSSPLPTPQTPRDFAGASTITITAPEVANAIFYSTVSYSTGTLTVNLPSYADMLATYGGQKLVPFYWGNLNIGSGQLVDINLSTLGNANLIWVNVPIQGNSAPVSLQNYFSGHPTPFALPTLQIWNGTAYIDDVSGTVSYNFAWAGFAN